MEAEKTAEKQQEKVVIGVPFKPGQSGNPNGRPKGSFSMITLIKKKAEELYPDDPAKQKTYGDMVVEQMYKKAIQDNDMAAIKEINDRIDGKAPLHISQDIKGEIHTTQVDISNLSEDEKVALIKLYRKIDGNK